MGSWRSPANWTERGRLKRSVPGLRDKAADYISIAWRPSATTKPLYRGPSLFGDGVRQEVMGIIPIADKEEKRVASHTLVGFE